MGNYHDIEIEFVGRTLRLIDQYLGLVDQFKFEEQYNYTLTLNCLLGLIVMPKERVVSFIPTDRLTSEYKKKIGLVESHIPEEIATLRDLITKLRHSVVIAEVKLTPSRRSNFDPLGEDGGFSSRRDVDPGASGGDQGFRTTRSLDSADHERHGAVA